MSSGILQYYKRCFGLRMGHNWRTSESRRGQTNKKNLLGAGFIDGRRADRIFQCLNGSLQQCLIKKEQNFNQNFHWPQHLTVLLLLKHCPVLLYSHICLGRVLCPDLLFGFCILCVKPIIIWIHLTKYRTKTALSNTVAVFICFYSCFDNSKIYKEACTVTLSKLT